MAVLVAESLPIDQHYVQNPDDLFNRNIDELMLDLDSKVVLEAHLQCAAYEMPITKEDSAYFGPGMCALCDIRLLKDKEGWQAIFFHSAEEPANLYIRYHPNPKFLPFPSKHVSIRGIQEEMYTIVDVTHVGQSGRGPKVLEEIEVSRVIFEAFEGAVV